MPIKRRHPAPKRHFADIPKDYPTSMTKTTNGVGAAPDADLQGDDAYTMLNALHDNYVQLMQAPALLQPLVQRQALIAAVADKEALRQYMETLDRDVKTYAEKLNKIFDRHRNRTGDSADGDDRFKAIQIHEEYQQWMTSYGMVVIPTLSTIFEIFEKAESDLKATEGTATPDPSVDVVEVTSTKDKPDA